MKRLFLVVLIVFFALAHAQSSNRFTESEQVIENQTTAPDGGEQEEGIGNPGEPVVSVNQHLYLLLATGIMMIFISTYKNKRKIV